MNSHSISKWGVFILILALCLSVKTAAYAGAVSSWPMFHHDAQHTGQAANTGPLTNTLKWSYGVTSNVPPDTPSISGDGLTLYVNVGGSKLTALSTATGQVLWSQTISGEGATAVAADGTVYAVGGSQLYAYTSAGTLKWLFSGATAAIHGEPSIGSDGTIYAGSWDTYVYAVNPDGSLKWKYKTIGSIAPLASPTLSPDGQTLYVGSGDPHMVTDGTLYAIATYSGNLKWSKKIDNSRASGAVVAQDGTVYACGGGSVYAFNSSGTQLWQSAAGTASSLTPGLSSAGILYVGTSNGKINAINAANGALLWSYQTGANPAYPNGPQYGVLTAPVIGSDSTVYVGAVDGKMYALKSDGALLWAYPTSLSIAENSPAIGADGTLYFSSTNTYLYAVKDAALSSYTLSVTKSGTGGGTVSSSPAGISCGSACSSSYTAGTTVTLTASADNGSISNGWTGCDSTSWARCTLSISANKSVAATFTSGSSMSLASTWINAVYAQYPTFFGTTSGALTTVIAASGTYYVQWFTNGTAILAYLDGYMYFYYGGGWNSFAIVWSDPLAATAMINAVYSEYPTFFGAKSGGVASASDSNGTLYIQWYTNGTAIIAYSNGYMYFYYGGGWYAFGTKWK